MENRCRLCAEIHQNPIEVSQNVHFLTLLFNFFQLKILEEDKLPKLVCDLCFSFIKQTWQFKQRINRSQVLLNELLNAAEKITQIEEEHHKNGHKKNEKLNETAADAINIKKSTKRVKRRLNNNVKIGKSEDLSETFKEIEFINADGTIIPKCGIENWNSYQWTCSECSMIFYQADRLRDHFSTNHNIVSVRYICVDCPKVYSKYLSFISHVRYHRPFLKFSCDVCYKWFRTMRELKQHQILHNQIDPYHCTICGKKFRLQSLLNLHTRSHLPSDVKNCYPCNHCSKKFGTKPNLMAHKRIHLGIKEYTCDQCGKSFVQKGNLENHLLTHNVNRPYHCSVCDKTFKSLIQLRKHSSVHSGLKPHKCNICGRQFRERGTLKEHHRIHTGAMPFSCEFCGKCFRFKGVLTTHRRQHTGERPYSCTECQHHFTNWPNYNKHMKRRHGINTSVNCRTKQEIPPTGKPNRNPPGLILATPQSASVLLRSSSSSSSVINNSSSMNNLQEVYQHQHHQHDNIEVGNSAGFYPTVLDGLYGINNDADNN